MDISRLRKIEALADNLNRKIPPSHKKAFEVHQAPRELEDQMESLFELCKIEAVVKYIEAQPEDNRDRRTLSKLQPSAKYHRNNLEKAHTLEKQLTGIAIGLEIEQEAKAAGAINPALVADYMKKTQKIISRIDSDGDVRNLADGMTIKDAIKEMTDLPDTKHLFGNTIIEESTGGSENGSKAYSGKNPWAKENFNLTEQGKIWKHSPALAARLKAEAQKADRPKGGNPWIPENLNATEQGRIFKENPALAKRMILEAGKDPSPYGL